MSSTPPATTAPAAAAPAGYIRKSTPGAGGNFLKWSDGETKELIVLSTEPVVRKIHWTQNHSADCTGATCALCAAGDKPKLRWTVHVEDLNGEHDWDIANQTCSDLETMAEMTGHLVGLVLRVKRTGAGRLTRYTLMPVQAPTSTAAAPVDYAAAKEEIVRICKASNVDPKAQYTRFVTEVRPDLVKADGIAILPAMLTWIRATLGAALAAAPAKELAGTSENIIF